jgi:hypothetical protein
VLVTGPDGARAETTLSASTMHAVMDDRRAARAGAGEERPLAPGVSPDAVPVPGSAALSAGQPMFVEGVRVDDLPHVVNRIFANEGVGLTVEDLPASAFSPSTLAARLPAAFEQEGTLLTRKWVPGHDLLGRPDPRRGEWVEVWLQVRPVRLLERVTPRENVGIRVVDRYQRTTVGDAAITRSFTPLQVTYDLPEVVGGWKVTGSPATVEVSSTIKAEIGKRTEISMYARGPGDTWNLGFVGSVKIVRRRVGQESDPSRVYYHYVVAGEAAITVHESPEPPPAQADPGTRAWRHFPEQLESPATWIRWNWW